MAAMKKSYKDALLAPLLLWLAFTFVALVMGFTQTVNTSVEILVGDTPTFLAIIFGLWVGIRTYRNLGDHLGVAMLNGLIVSLVIGAASLIFILLMAQISPEFAQAYGSLSVSSSTSPYGQSALTLASIVETGVASWIKLVLVTIASAALGLEFFSKK